MKTSILVLGIGNRLRGDDGVGSIVAEQLAQEGLVPAIDCGEMPDNYISKVWQMKPDEVLLIDACDFKGRPGEVRVIAEAEFDRIPSSPLSTHQMPLPLLVAVMKTDPQVKCRVRLIGIQPQEIGMFVEGLSEPVAAAIPAVKALVAELLAEP
jgi:hydrogenase 3 maturation protease